MEALKPVHLESRVLEPFGKRKPGPPAGTSWRQAVIRAEIELALNTCLRGHLAHWGIFIPERTIISQCTAHWPRYILNSTNNLIIYQIIQRKVDKALAVWKYRAIQVSIKGNKKETNNVHLIPPIGLSIPIVTTIEQPLT